MLRADGLVTKCLLLAHLRQEEIKLGSPEGLRRMYLTNRGQGKVGEFGFVFILYFIHIVFVLVLSLTPEGQVLTFY